MDSLWQSPGPVYSRMDSRVRYTGTTLLYLYLCPPNLCQQRPGNSTTSNAHPISMQTLWFQVMCFILPSKWRSLIFLLCMGCLAAVLTLKAFWALDSLLLHVSQLTITAVAVLNSPIHQVFLMWLNKKPHVLTNTSLDISSLQNRAVSQTLS